MYATVLLKTLSPTFEHVRKNKTTLIINKKAVREER